MAFGIPSEDFHGGFGLPHDEFIKAYKDYMTEYRSDEEDMSDEECDEIAQEAHDNLVRSLVEAGGEIREARELLVRSLEMLYLLGYDSGFTNSAIDTLITDIKQFLREEQ